MLWDASFDSNNNIDGKYYSSYISDIIRPEPELGISFPRLQRPHRWLKFPVLKLLGWLVIILSVLVILKVLHRKYLLRNQIHHVGKPPFEEPPSYHNTIPQLYLDPMPYSYDNVNLPPYDEAVPYVPK